MASFRAGTPLRKVPHLLEGVYNAQLCAQLVSELDAVKKSPFVTYKEIAHTQSQFRSYEFDFGGGEAALALYEDAFNYLLSRYVENGFDSPWASVGECHRSGEFTSGAFLNPLVFEYRIPSEFGWHAHSARYQKFQLVMNISSPGFDYASSTFEVAFNASASWKLRFHPQGGVFSFPYPYAHRVTEIKPLSEPCVAQRYVHLLMPIHPRGGFKGAFIPLPGWSCQLLSKDKSIASFG